jgi:predicted choloylglycine hydrolase
MKLYLSLLSIALMLCFNTGCLNKEKKAKPVETISQARALLDRDVNDPQDPEYSNMPQVIMVSGTNYEMGMQYGRKAAPLINHNLTLFKSDLLQYFGKENIKNDMSVWAYYIEKYDPDLKEWLEGISEGCRKEHYKIDYLDLLLITVYPSEMMARPNIPYPEEVKIKTKLPVHSAEIASKLLSTEKELHSCSSFAATGTATKDGKTIVAISKMFNVKAKQSLVLIVFPESGLSFISFPCAGAVAHNQGMNSKGFAWTLTAIFSDKPVWGLITEAYFHFLCQFCKSPDEAIKFLSSTPRAGPIGNFTLSDSSGYIAVFESNPYAFALRKPGDYGEKSFVINTNHFVDSAMKSYNYPYINLEDTHFRYATLLEYVSAAAENSEIDFNFVSKLFTSDDWFDPDIKKWHYNDPGSPNVLNNFSWSPALSQTIFFPSTLTTYYQIGTPSGIGLPAYATGEYIEIKLSENPDDVTAYTGYKALELYKNGTNRFRKTSGRKQTLMTIVCSMPL